MSEKKCEFCKKIFIQTRNQRFCSKSCSAKMSNKKKWSDPLYRKKILKTFQSEEYKKKCSTRQTEQWKDKEYREKNIKSWKATFNSSDHTRNLISKNTKEMWKDPEKKKIISKKIKDSLNTKEMKNWRSNLMLEKWKDDKYANKWMKSCFTYKDYELPSGRIIKLQGYEPEVLTNLLKTYKENDILTGKDISNKLGKIIYLFENKKHRYFPDIYIISTNTIIEVKSVHTFNLHKEKNLAKEKACKEMGYSFIFEVIKK